mmetsp:Transcript_6393/g.9501  ORF Transcript_6393/g.9501 Transcript_6393/m.9501 type:complete len:83 (-) Transcript_6393:599-847(-)
MNNATNFIQAFTENEEARSQVLQKYYGRFEDIIRRFEEIREQASAQIQSLEDQNQEKAKQTQYLADIASQFYQKLQRFASKV